MHVLIADDHALVREGLKRILFGIDPNAVFIECKTVADAASHSADCDALDLAIIDLIKPGMNGISGLAAFRSQKPDVPILVLGDCGSRQVTFAAFEMGVAGFIRKESEATAMTNAIQLVLSGERYVPAEMILKPGSVEEALNDNPLHRLSGREKDVLARLMEGSTNKEIAQAIKVEEVTVKLHLSRIYRKFGVSNRTQAVMLARDHGWEALMHGPCCCDGQKIDGTF